jgi:hypothetical protein
VVTHRSYSYSERAQARVLPFDRTKAYILPDKEKFMKTRIAIIGAGMGGLAATAALQAFGFEVRVYEQAERFTRLGAGIQMSPNAIRALRGLGLESAVRRCAFQPGTWSNRDGSSGAMKFELPLGRDAEERYGAPYLQMHRGDLHEVLLSALPAAVVIRGKQLVETAAVAGGGGSPIARHFPLPYCAIRSANTPSGGARTGIS